MINLGKFCLFFRPQKNVIAFILLMYWLISYTISEKPLIGLWSNETAIFWCCQIVFRLCMRNTTCCFFLNISVTAAFIVVLVFDSIVCIQYGFPTDFQEIYNCINSISFLNFISLKNRPRPFIVELQLSDLPIDTQNIDSP